MRLAVKQLELIFVDGRNGSPSSRPGIDSNPGLGVTHLKFLCEDIQSWYRISFLSLLHGLEEIVGRAGCGFLLKISNSLKTGSDASR